MSLAQNSHRPMFKTGNTCAASKSWALSGGQREAASHSKYWDRLRWGVLESGPRQVVHGIKGLISDHTWSWQSLFWSSRSNLSSAKSYKAFPEHPNSKTKMEIYSIFYKAQSPWAEKSSAHTALRSSFPRRTQLRARQLHGHKWGLLHSGWEIEAFLCLQCTLNGQAGKQLKWDITEQQLCRKKLQSSAWKQHLQLLSIWHRQSSQICSLWLTAYNRVI